MPVSRCPHCQQLLLPDEALAPACAGCGGALPGAATMAETPAPSPAPAAPAPRPRTPWVLWAAVVLLAVSNGATVAWMLWPSGAPRPMAAPQASLVDAARPTESAPPSPPENHAADSHKDEIPTPPTKPALDSHADEAVNPAAPTPPPAAPMPPALIPFPPAPPPVAAAPMPPGIPPPPWLEGLANLDELRGRIEWNAAGDVVALRLGDSEVSDGDLILLRPFDSLRELNLDHTHITEKGLIYLQSLKELRSLSLHGIPVTDAGVAALQKALPDLKIIR